MFRTKICVEFDSQTNYFDSLRIITNKKETFIIFTRFTRIFAEMKSVSINYG